jgi:hypothetical protein
MEVVLGSTDIGLVKVEPITLICVQKERMPVYLPTHQSIALVLNPKPCVSPYANMLVLISLMTTQHKACVEPQELTAGLDFLDESCIISFCLSPAPFVDRPKSILASIHK